MEMYIEINFVLPVFKFVDLDIGFNNGLCSYK